MRVVLDTNVLLAALATRGLCEAVVEVCLADHELFVSRAIIDEVEEHLGAKFAVPPERVALIAAWMEEEFTVVEPAAVPADACRDADDLAVIGTAVAAQADCIVSGDKDLLKLRHYGEIRMLSPRAFHDLLRDAWPRRR